MSTCVLEALLLRTPTAQPAVLEGYHCYRIKDQPYPAIVAKPGSSVAGLLLCDLSDLERTILDYFEDEAYVKVLMMVNGG